MTFHAYVFEAKAIQRYVTDGGRLKDVAGGSALLHQLTAGQTGREETGAASLDKVLKQAKFKNGDAFLARRTGGAFILVDGEGDAEQRLRTFRALWRLAVGVTVPGLSFADGLGAGATAREALEDAQKKAGCGCRPEWPDRPPIGPLTMLAQRTGCAAVKIDEADQESTEFLDAAQERKRADLKKAKWTLGRHLASEPDTWPDEVEHMIPEGFPRRTLAVLHIDANGMGEHLKAVADDLNQGSEPFEKRMRAFSDAVETAIRESARMASEAALTNDDVQRGKKGCIPARPIVLAGDELTLVMRADCAPPFLKAFVEKAERQIDGRDITFGAGIAFVHVRHPFSDAVDLAASLCAFAKREARQRLGGSGRAIPSVVAFHRALEARGGDYAAILSGDLTVKPECGRPVRLTLGPYRVDGGQDPGDNGQNNPRLPTLSGLEKLMGVLARDEASRGPLRRCLAELQEGLEEQADRTFNRWRTVVPEKTQTQLGEAIFCGLPPLKRNDPPGKQDWTLFISPHRGATPATALADAQALLAAAGPPPDPRSDESPPAQASAAGEGVAL